MNPNNWAEMLPVAITVMDADGLIVYMNEKSKQTFEKYGGGQLLGKNLLEFHKPESRLKIQEIIDNGTFNCYTIEKDGIRKMIYQTPWFIEGKYAGLLELSMEITENMPHFDRN